MILPNLLKRQCLIVHVVKNLYIFLQHMDNFFPNVTSTQKVASWSFPIIIRWVRYFSVTFVPKIFGVSIKGSSMTILLSEILT